MIEGEGERKTKDGRPSFYFEREFWFAKVILVTWRLPVALIGIALLPLVLGCDQRGRISSQGEASVTGTNQPAGKPQPKLPTTKLWIGREVLTVEVARTQEEISKGMMYRKELDENEGMLFVFPRPRQVSFFMRNTTIPLSCAYVDSDGTILEIHKMEPLDETPVRSSSDKVRYVLEVRQGWFQRHQIQEGAVMQTEAGSLEATFFGSSSYAR